MKAFLFAFLAVAITGLTAPADPAFQALEEEQLDQSGTVITILFDDSGSMAGERIDQAKAAFRDWLATVPDDHRLGLVALNAGQLVEWNRGNKSEVADAVARMRVQGGTPLADMMDAVMSAMEKRQAERPFERHVLVVFTDGEDTTPRGTRGVQQSLAEAARHSVETVGIGFHGAGDYMSSSATRYFNASNTEELKQGLEKVDAEIGDTSDIVISPEVAEAMKTVSFADMKPASPGQTAQVEHSQPSGKSVPFTFIIVVAVFVMIGVQMLLKVVRGK